MEVGKKTLIDERGYKTKKKSELVVILRKENTINVTRL